MYTRNRIITLLVVFLFFCTTVITIYAATNEIRNTSFAGTTAVAQKIVSSNSTHVNCTSKSFTQHPDKDITHIGYKTFSCTVQRSDGTYQQLKDLNGDLDYNDWHHTKLLSPSVAARAGFSRNSTSAGVHDFGHFDGTSHHWDPPLSVQQTFFP